MDFVGGGCGFDEGHILQEVKFLEQVYSIEIQ